MLLDSTRSMKLAESPPGRGKGRQALGWVVDQGNEPTPALTRHPSEEGILDHGCFATP